MKLNDCTQLNSRGKTLICALLCLALLIGSFSPVFAQDETPPPPETAEVTVTETPDPGLESTPETVAVVVSTEVTPTQLAALDQAVPTAASLLVEFDAEISKEELIQSLSQFGIIVPSELEKINFVLLQIPQDSYESALLELGNTPGVLLVQANDEVGLADTFPNDPAFGSQYGLTAINAPQGWDYGTGSSLITIAMIDSGVDLTHPDLLPKIVSGYDFVNGDTDPMDDNGHGTHVAGIAAAVTNNNSGMAGVSWGAQIMPIKVLDSNGNGTFDGAAQGVIYAVDHGAQVINLSLGGSFDSPVLASAIAYAYSHGVVVVASTGNGDSTVLYPAAYSEVIAVGASDQFNHRAGFSNYGPEVDVAAPGVDIYSTALGGGYEGRSGTSMATAFVSGEVALLLSINSGLTPDEVAYIIKSTALDIDVPGVDDNTGNGLIQVDAAMAVLQPSPTAEPPVVAVVVQDESSATEKTKERQETTITLPSPTPSGSPLPIVTLPATVATEPEISAQMATPTPLAFIPTTGSAELGRTNSWLSFVIGILAGLIGILIYFRIRRKNTNP